MTHIEQFLLDMKPENLTEEEARIWSNTQLNEYHRARNILAKRAVNEMLKTPLTREEAISQVIRLFKSDLVLTPEEEVVWNNTELTEHQRVLAIHEIRAVKKRAEYLVDNIRIRSGRNPTQESEEQT